jgi:hypothetical protein
VAVAPTDPRAVLAGLRARATALGEALYGIETEPEFKLLGDASELTGPSATAAAGAKARIDHLWLLFPSLTEGVDHLEQAIVDDNRPEVWRLLGPSAVVLPDAAVTGIAALAVVLETDLAEARGSMHRLAQAWRAVVPKGDRLTAEVDRLVEVAADLGVGSDRDLAAARRLTDGLATRVASDPLGIDIGAVERAVEQARLTIDGLAGQHRSLPDDLARAAGQLVELDRLIAAGSEALDAARAKVKQAAGLLQPLDGDALDADDERAPALRPWLARIEAMAQRGEWRAAVTGLARWRRVADGWVANARVVVEANRAPVRRRNELRGLLDGYRVKAAAAKLAEDTELIERFQVARAALETAPCDLNAAAERVDEYIGAVNRAIQGS